MAGRPRRSQALQILERNPYQEGDTIFREGETGNRAYILQQGKVEFFKRVNDEDVLVGSVGKGGIFGEMALIDNAPRMATAVAAEYSVCILVSEVLFNKKLEGLDPFLAGVMRVLVENIRSIQDTKLARHEIDTLIEAEPAVVEIHDADGHEID